MNKNLDGKTYFPLKVERQILKIREDIESNKQHAGEQFELVKAAYSEIKVAHGGEPTKYTSSCSGCTLTMNKIIQNWLKLYDQQGESVKRMSRAPESKPLKPIAKKASETEQGNELSYAVLLKQFKAIATDEEKASINKGKNPNKAQIIKFLSDGK